MPKQAQLFTIDFFLALFIFSILLIASMVSWNNYNSKIISEMEYNTLMNKAFQISNALVKSQGYPVSWNSENVQIIGLASDDRMLSSDKVNEFIDIPKNTTEKIFKIYEYDFYFSLKNMDNVLLKEYGYNLTNAKKSASIRRYVLYDGEKAVMEFTLWK